MLIATRSGKINISKEKDTKIVAERLCKLVNLGDLIPSIASSKKIIEKYDKGIKEGEFYEEPTGGDFNNSDW